MNQFEQQMNQVPYYDDWGKQRAEIKSVIREFVHSSNANSSPIGAMFFQMVEKNIGIPCLVLS